MQGIHDQNFERLPSKDPKVEVDITSPPSLKLIVGDMSHSKQSSKPRHLHQLVNESSSQEFLEALDNASVAEIEVYMGAMALKHPERSSTSLENSIENSWLKVMEVPAEPRRLFSILGWWESRRALYNVVVGSIGLSMAALDFLCMRIPGDLLGCVLVVCAAFAIMANICYLLGPTLELMARSVKKYDRYGPILFTVGLIFSICVVVGFGLLLIFRYLLFEIQQCNSIHIFGCSLRGFSFVVWS